MRTVQLDCAPRLMVWRTSQLCHWSGWVLFLMVLVLLGLGLGNWGSYALAVYFSKGGGLMAWAGSLWALSYVLTGRTPWMAGRLT